MLQRWIGQRSERQAERFLVQQGLRTLARNWHCRHGELDLVMLDGEALVFVEVRMRSPRGFGGGIESVDQRKQLRLTRAAALFLADRPEWQERPCRFDVLAIDGPGGVEHWLRDAFEIDAGF